jgi:hypothetical protein
MKYSKQVVEAHRLIAIGDLGDHDAVVAGERLGGMLLMVLEQSQVWVLSRPL